MKKVELIFLVEEDPEGGLTAKAVGESIFTQGENMEEIKANIRDAISCHYGRKDDIPASIRLQHVKQPVTSVLPSKLGDESTISPSLTIKA